MKRSGKEAQRGREGRDECRGEPGGLPGGLRWSTLFLALSAVSCLFKPIDLSMHDVVRNITYGEDKPVPRVDHELYLYAVLKPVLVRKYSNCSEAVSAIRATSWEELTDLGRKLNGAGSQEDWALEMTHWTGFERTKADPMVPLAVGEAAAQLASYIKELGAEPSQQDEARPPGHVAQVRAAGEKARATILNQVCDAAPTHLGPSLALSGGSANGAFVAGFLYQVLYWRELIWRALPSHTEKQAFLESSKFSGVVGSSVGSMLGQLMDLYAVEDFGIAKDLVTEQFKKDKQSLSIVTYEVSRKPPLQAELEDLLTHPPATDAELARKWTLLKLFVHFTDLAEPEAICVLPGPVSRIAGYPVHHHPGLMRFDPLEREIMNPLLRVASSAMIDNGFPRVAVSVEVSQNVTVGLDDTACRGQGTNVQTCLAAGTMAASVLPFFAQPVNRVWTGLSSSSDCGIWLDGGLRSGFPIERALLLSRPSDDAPAPRIRTLALSTGRATGVPSSKTDDMLLDIARQAVTEMGNQVQVSEVLSSSHFVLLEQQRWQELRRHGGLAPAESSVPEAPAPESSCSDAAAAPPAGASRDGVSRDGVSRDGVKAERASPAQHAISQGVQEAALDDNPYLEVVFVPRKVPDYLVASAGYRFDPVVMRGLFASGQLEAIERAKRAGSAPADGTPAQGLLERLGWPHASDVLGPLDRDRGPLELWLRNVDAAWKDEAPERHKNGSERFEKRVSVCVEAPTAEEEPKPPGRGAPPAYFGGRGADCRKAEGE